MIEAVTISGLLALLLLLTVLYTKRMLRAQQKYTEAKTVLNDIILSYNKQLHRQDNKLALTNHKISEILNRETLISKALETHDKELRVLAEKETSSVSDRVFGRIESLGQELNGLKTLKDSLLVRVSKIERENAHYREPEPRIKSAIPIKREKALAPLTKTELTVLELLAKEREKTAPEIKKQISLSREHTARLMKKLYAEGYLERSADKIPFKYRLKEEMQKILKNPKQEN